MVFSQDSARFTSSSGVAQPIVAIILAAGRSTRLGRFKPLEPLGDGTILGRCIALFRSAGVQENIVVAGHRAEEVLAAADRLGAHGVVNTGYDAGMLSSILCGLKAAEQSGAALVLPVDTPLVGTATIQALLASWLRQPDDMRVIAPAFRGEPGHPVLIGSGHFSAIRGWDGPEGLRGYLARHARTETVAVADEAILLDADTPEDLRCMEALRVLHEEHGAPSVTECRALWELHGASGGQGQQVQAHCELVAKIAVYLATKMDASAEISFPRIEAAGLLHDLAKGQPQHAAAGARLLDQAGWPRIARLVEAHAWLEGDAPDMEQEIVFFADKLACGDRPVTLRQRFGAKRERFAADAAALAGLEQRYDQAMRAKRRISAALQGADAEAVALEVAAISGC